VRRAAKIDGTHREIVDALVKMGATVLPLHTVGNGCPDIAVSIGNRWHMIEIKNGKLAGWELTDAQKKFRIKHTAPVYILDSVDTAIAWLNKLNRRKAA